MFNMHAPSITSIPFDPVGHSLVKQGAPYFPYSRLFEKEKVPISLRGHVPIKPRRAGESLGWPVPLQGGKRPQWTFPFWKKDALLLDVRFVLHYPPERNMGTAAATVRASLSKALYPPSNR